MQSFPMGIRDVLVIVVCKTQNVEVITLLEHSNLESSYIPNGGQWF